MTVFHVKDRIIPETGGHTHVAVCIVIGRSTGRPGRQAKMQPASIIQMNHARTSKNCMRGMRPCAQLLEDGDHHVTEDCCRARATVCMHVCMYRVQTVMMMQEI